MHHAARTLILLGLLVPLTPLAEAAPDDAPPLARIRDAPLLVPADGSAFAAVVAVEGPAHAEVDVRVTVLSGSASLARAWTGAAWAPGTRYQLVVTLDTAGRWSGPVALALAEPAPEDVPVRVAARARLADARDPGPWHARAATLASPGYATALPALARGEAAWLVRADGTPVGSVTRTTGVPVLVGPREDGLRVSDGAGARAAPPVPAVQVARLHPAEDRLDLARADGNGTLAGVCMEAGRAGAACVAADAGAEARLHVPLADGGGDVRVTLGPVLLDAAAYPRVRADEELVRTGPDAWRAVRAGRTAFEATPFPVRAVTPLVLPEDGYATLAALVANATRTLDVQVFTLESAAVARLLVDAAARGVRVRVLLDGSPPGGVAPEERRAVAALAAAGVPVREGGAQYRSHHAKVVLADDARVLVASENLNPTSWPADATAAARRGWGVIVDDPDVTRWFARVFHADWAAARAYADGTAFAGPPPRLAPAPVPARPPAATVPAARVTPVLAPDDAVAPVTALLARANRTLDVQQLAIAPAWDAVPNPFLDAVVAAARRGVTVRVLVDGAFASAENRLVVERLNALAAQGNLTLEARVGPPERVLHNKGVLVDARFALVGSLNWVRAAAEDNREAALLVDAPAAARAWGAAFDADWRDAAPAADAPEAGADVPGVGAALAVAAAALTARRRRPPNPSPSSARSRRRGPPRTPRTRPCSRAR